MISMAENEFSSSAHNRFLAEKKLIGVRCKRCGAISLPPRPICPKCNASDMELVEMKGRGKLVAYTVISVGPPMMIEEGFDRERPYCSGIVELEEGVRIPGRIVGVNVAKPDQIKIGTPVTVEYQERVHGEETRTFLAFRAP
jgi:uncharacterized OB-fold protein